MRCSIGGGKVVILTLKLGQPSTVHIHKYSVSVRRCSRIVAFCKDSGTKRWRPRRWWQCRKIRPCDECKEGCLSHGVVCAARYVFQTILCTTGNLFVDMHYRSLADSCASMKFRFVFSAALTFLIGRSLPHSIQSYVSTWHVASLTPQKANLQSVLHDDAACARFTLRPPSSSSPPFYVPVSNLLANKCSTGFFPLDTLHDNAHTPNYPHASPLPNPTQNAQNT